MVVQSRPDHHASHDRRDAERQGGLLIRSRWFVAGLALAGGLVAAAPAPAQAPTSPSAPFAYALPGDQIVVRVWPQQAVGGPVQVVVDPQGAVVLPMVGEISVAGIPVRVLRDSLRVRYERFLREPEVDVTVMRRVTINGAVLRPDVYYMDAAARVRDVVARAGGVSEVGNRDKVTIVRGGVAIRVQNWEIDTTDVSLLRSGDHVVVGRQSWFKINIIPFVSLSMATVSFILTMRAALKRN